MNEAADKGTASIVRTGQKFQLRLACISHPGTRQVLNRRADAEDICRISQLGTVKNRVGIAPLSSAGVICQIACAAVVSTICRAEI